MQSSRKQPSRRLEKRENSRRWLLIPALCAAVILAVVLIVELNKQPQVAAGQLQHHSRFP